MAEALNGNVHAKPGYTPAYIGGESGWGRDEFSVEEFQWLLLSGLNNLANKAKHAYKIKLSLLFLWPKQLVAESSKVCVDKSNILSTNMVIHSLDHLYFSFLYKL